MMQGLGDGARLARAASALVWDHMAAKEGESILVTADSGSDASVVDALVTAAGLVGARPVAALIPRLPFQGRLADPYLPSALRAAAVETDIWIDLTHPFLAGSEVHDAALGGKRARYLGAGGLDAAGLIRLYGMVDGDRLFELQSGVDALIADAVGKECRVTDMLGTEVTFTLAKATQTKTRRALAPGSNTIPGSSVLLPEIESVRGKIRLVAAMHEYYAPFTSPLTLAVDGRIRAIEEEGPEAALLDRALRRAGRGEYGHVIHFSYGFHPAARFRGTCFVEDIRFAGCNAIGLGTPWWAPGGGENHPDGIVMGQTLEVSGKTIVRQGRLVAPAELATLAAEMKLDHDP
jgi:2,5-dihydroxypyridine 5,6-dioxygenase